MLEFSDNDLKTLIKNIENDNLNRDFRTLGYSLISSVYLKKGDYKNSLLYQKKYINQLSETTNINISKSFALRHSLNIFQKLSIEKFVLIFSVLSRTNNAISDLMVGAFDIESSTFEVIIEKISFTSNNLIYGKIMKAKICI